MLRRMTLTVLMILFSVSFSHAQQAQLWETGQTTCYDTNGNVISCPGTGQDGDIQAGVSWPNPRFTVSGDCVTDNLTGLMWTKNANLPGTTKTWQQAIDYAINLSLCGYDDWRLPNRKEIHSLTDFSRYNPALPSGHPFTNVQSNYYWSSTSNVDGPVNAWIVNMWNGFMYYNLKSNFNVYVWPVRSGQVGPLVHSIIGSVTENSVGLGGVTMTLSGAASATTTTAGDGTYSFASLADGNYTVTPDMNGYTFSPASISVTVAGADATGIDFTASSGPDISVLPTSYDFGSVNPGLSSSSKTFTVSNSGVANLVIGLLSLAGTDPSQFSITNDNCSGKTIAPSGNCSASAFFKPTSYGAKSANLNIPSNDPDTPTLVVSLQGTGGPTGNSTVKGTVYDDSRNLLSGVNVAIGTYTTITDGSGQYSITDIPSGDYLATISKDGYATRVENMSIPPLTVVVKDFTLTPIVVSGDIQVLSITSKYPGHVNYLDGVDHLVTYMVNVDWAGHPTGVIRFITPKGTYDISTSDTTAFKTFNMGTEFGPCGKLKVQAISSDSSTSQEKEADFDVMPSPVPLLPGFLQIIDTGDSFHYSTSEDKDIVGFNMSFIEQGIDAGIIPEDIPVFGDSPFRLDFIPEVSADITSDGTFDMGFRWGDLEAGQIMEESWGRDHNLKKIIVLLDDFFKKGRLDRRRMPKSAISKFNLNLFPILNIDGEFFPATCEWGYEGAVGVAGELNLKETWQTVCVPCIIPIPWYIKLNMNLSVDATIGLLDVDPLSLNGQLGLSPYVRGSLGIGVDEVLSGEGWVGGGGDMQLQYPETPALKDLTIYIDAGFTVYAFLWTKEFQGLRWDWNIYTSPVSPISLTSSAKPELLSRDYLKMLRYGSFKKIPRYSFRTLSLNGLSYTTSIAPLQTNVFPYSEASVSSNGNNLYLAWLYDDPNRSSMNRTVAIFSSWDGTAWSIPQAVADDGTADFHPEILTFTDGSAVAAWEDENSVMPDTATFDDMVQNLEISVSQYNPQAVQWAGSQRLTSNAYIDRSPKLAGILENDIILTWISNEANDIYGSATTPNKIWYSRWDGISWGTPAEVSQIPFALIKYSIAYNGLEGHMIMSLDTDGDSITIDDHELYGLSYTNGSWGPLTRLTDDLIADDNPQLALDPDGNFVLVWLKGNEISSGINLDMNNRNIVRVDEYTSNLADFKLTASADGKLSVVWAESSDYSSDIYAIFYDPVFGVWGNPKQLTADSETERHLTTTFYGANTIVAVYNRNIVGLTSMPRQIANGKTVTLEVPVPISTDLYMMKYTMGDDLALEGGSLIASPLNPLPGENISLSAKAMNLGDKPAQNVPVAFYLGDPANGGTEIGEVVISQVLSPGDAIDVSMAWAVPQTTTPLAIFAVIDPLATFDPLNRFNNVISTEVVKPDLTIKSVKWEKVTESLFSIIARVSNDGTISSGITDITFKKDASNGELLFTQSVSLLTPYESTDVNFAWDVSAIPLPRYVVSIGVDEGGVVNEFDENNNSTSILIEGNLQDIDVSPLSTDFGSVGVGSSSGTQDFTATNTGTAELTFGAITLTGVDAAEFIIQSDNCSNQVIVPGGSCTVQAVFSPASAGPKNASLSIPSNDPDVPVWDVPLSGVGVSTLNVSINPVGSGTITGTGINCPGDCTESYNTQGVSVQLTATPNNGYQFVSWGGDTDCSDGIATMDTNKDCIANFNLLDTTPPTGSIIINNNAVWTKTTAVTLTLDCTDSESGCADMRFSNDNINFTGWEPFSTSKPWPLPSGDGEKWVYVQYRDGAGNLSESLSDSINLDTTKPVVKGVSDLPDPFKPSLGEVSKIRFTLLDNLSGTCMVQVKIYNPANTLVRTIKKNGVSCTIGGAAGSLKWNGRDTDGNLVPMGTYTYKIQATDNASNKSVIKQGTSTVQ